MESLEIRRYPDPVLRKKAEHVSEVRDEERNLITQMKDTMYANQGIGLAAPQIGISKRIIVLDVGYGLIKMINPEVVSREGSSWLEEGCLSVSNRTVNIERPEKIQAIFTDEENKEQKASFSGLAAKAIQHEIDHLNGKLIVDYLPWYKKILPARTPKAEKCLQ